MNEEEFDKIAEEYSSLTQKVLGVSGESTEFFAEYKVKDTLEAVANLKYPSDLEILDFGSGVGGAVPYFLKYFPSCQLTCLDVSRKSLEIAANRFEKKACFKHFNGQKIPSPNDTFHIVFTACVFHHIPDKSHKSLLHEIHRVLKPGGIFIAFEHNPYNFLTVKAVDACPFDENAVLIKGSTFKRKIVSVGFLDEKLKYRIFFPSQLKQLRFLEKYMTWIPLGAQYYVYGQKSY